MGVVRNLKGLPEKQSMVRANSLICPWNEGIRRERSESVVKRIMVSSTHQKAVLMQSILGHRQKLRFACPLPGGSRQFHVLRTWNFIIISIDFAGHAPATLL